MILFFPRISSLSLQTVPKLDQINHWKQNIQRSTNTKGSLTFPFSNMQGAPRHLCNLHNGNPSSSAFYGIQLTSSNTSSAGRKLHGWKTSLSTRRNTGTTANKGQKQSFVSERILFVFFEVHLLALHTVLVTKPSGLGAHKLDFFQMKLNGKMHSLEGIWCAPAENGH